MVFAGATVIVEVVSAAIKAPFALHLYLYPPVDGKAFNITLSPSQIVVEPGEVSVAPGHWARADSTHKTISNVIKIN